MRIFLERKKLRFSLTVNMTMAEYHHFILYLTILINMKAFTFGQTLWYNKWKFGTVWHNKWNLVLTTNGIIWPLILTSHHLINNLIAFRKSYIAQSLSLREMIRKYLKMQKNLILVHVIAYNNIIIVNCISDYLERNENLQWLLRILQIFKAFLRSLL